MQNRMTRKLIMTALLLLGVFAGFSQTTVRELMMSKDWSNVKVDRFSDDELLKYKDYILNAGYTEAQAEQIAIQRGLPSSEVLKLKSRLAGLQAGVRQPGKTKTTPGRTNSFDSTDIDTPVASEGQTEKRRTALEVFGSELFNTPSKTFEPDLRIPTPVNYTLGPDDELAIDVYGYQETNPRVTVSPEGYINIPNVGYVYVNGLTIEQATKRIRAKMAANGYSALNSGQTQLYVSLSKVRTIKVTVIGEVRRPGSYSISSLSTFFNALYTSGGPTARGSLRNIELIRNNKVVHKLDVYDFLLRGDQSHNVRLFDQDIIRIPVASIQATLKGEVNRPAIYEVLPGESLAKIIDYAGGFTNKAYTANVHVQQYTDTERKMKDVAKSQLSAYMPGKGDEIEVGRILERYTNRVSLSGAVFRPGKYELKEGMTLSQLIKNADGVKEDAFMERGLIFRINEDLSKQAISFNVTQLLSGNGNDIKLKKDDSVIVASLKDFKQDYTITVDGEVKKPSVYPYYEGITLKDILLQTGGFTDAAAVKDIEIARRIDNDSANSKVIAQVIEISTEESLGVKGNDIVLQPWDVIIVRSKPGYKSQTIVKLEGEVVHPGPYVLASKEERVSDLIKRAGGLTQQADKSGANITRINTSSLQADVDRVERIKKARDTTDDQLLQDITRPTVKLGLNLNKILEVPYSLEDAILQEGDIITVPKQRNVVKVNGEVMFPTEVVYKEGAGMDYYIDKAGGFTESARKSKVYVLNANGSAAKTSKFLFFKSYPNVAPGSEILVPKIPERRGGGLSTAEWVAIASGLASLAGVAVAIINVTKN